MWRKPALLILFFVLVAVVFVLFVSDVDLVLFFLINTDNLIIK